MLETSELLPDDFPNFGFLPQVTAEEIDLVAGWLTAAEEFVLNLRKTQVVRSLAVVADPDVRGVTKGTP